MIIDRVGLYKTNREYRGGVAGFSTWTIPKESEFRVTQIDVNGSSFMSDVFGDWEYWNRDVTRLSD